MKSEIFYCNLQQNDFLNDEAVYYSKYFKLYIECVCVILSVSIRKPYKKDLVSMLAFPRVLKYYFGLVFLWL